MTKFLPVVFITCLIACSPRPDSVADRTAPASAGDAKTTQVQGQTASGALVMLEPVGGAPLPEGNAVMDQFSKAFVPETLFVRVGQPVIFKNSEDQLHNVTVVRTRTGTGIFNTSQNQGDVYTHTFEQPGEYDVTCDVHPGMRGMVVATQTPYAVYADSRGSFSLQNIPPGEYTLRVATKGRDVERSVRISGAQLDLGEIR